MIGVSGLLAGVWYGTRLDALTIDQVTVVGGDTIRNDEVAAVIEDTLEGAYVRLIPRRFTWLYPHHDIVTALHTQFERLASVDITTTRTGMRVEVHEYVPDALWCEMPGSTNCWFVEESGLAFAPAPQLTGSAFTRYVRDNHAPRARTTLADTRTVADLRWFVEEIASIAGFYTDEIILHEAGWATVRLVGGEELLVSQRHDITGTLRYLETLLSSDEYRHLSEDGFQYIDLRFGNRLYVNETEAPTEMVSTSTPPTVPAAMPEDVVTTSTPAATTTPPAPTEDATGTTSVDVPDVPPDAAVAE